MDGSRYTSTSLSPGAYTLTAQDSNGCTSSGVLVTIDPAPPRILPSIFYPSQLSSNFTPETESVLQVSAQSNPTCPGTNTGSITLSATGGSGGFIYYVLYEESIQHFILWLTITFFFLPVE